MAHSGLWVAVAAQHRSHCEAASDGALGALLHHSSVSNSQDEIQTVLPTPLFLGEFPLKVLQM